MSFLKWRSGSKPGQAPKRSEPEVSAKRKYEETRERNFQLSWKTDREWLQFSDGKMFCTWCRDSALSPKEKQGIFVVGTDRFRYGNVKDHDKNALHARCVNKYTVGPDINQTPAGLSLIQLKKADYDRLAIKMRTAHYVAKHNKSYLDYVNICKLDKAKGLDIGESYINDKGAAQMVASIATVTLSPVIEKLKTCRFFSFTCDGSSDFTGEDMEILFVRSCTNREVSDQFLNIGIAKSASSADIHEYIKESFSNLSLQVQFQDKLVGFCSDGAANMQGVKSGLAALLKSSRPYLVSVHCLAHRLELSFKDSVKKCKLYDKTMVLLLGLYYLYRKSPKLKNGLKESFSAMQQKQVLPTRVGGTRWVPHLYRAIGAFFKGYAVIRHHLETASHTNAKAEGLAKIAADGHVMVYLLSLQVVLHPLVVLSKTLQKENLTLADATSQLSATRTVLSQLKEEDHTSIQEVVESKKYRGEVLKFHQKPDVLVSKLAEQLIGHIETRFPDSVDSTITATRIASFNNWPLSATDLKEFGNDAVETVVGKFREVLEAGDIDCDNITMEWKMLKALVAEKYPKELEGGTLDWITVNKAIANTGYDSILAVIDLLLSLPPTSVRNECGFSVMKLAKNKRRGRLGVESLNKLMVVNQLGPSVSDFDPKMAVENFMVTPSGRTRRVQGYKKMKKQSETTSTAQTTQEPIPIDESEEEEAASEEENEEFHPMLSLRLPYEKDYASSEDDEEDMEYSETDIDKLLSLYTRE